MLLHRGAEFAREGSRSRRRVPKGPRLRNWHWRRDIDPGEAFVALDVPAPADDAIGERHVRHAALQLAHLEPTAPLALYIKAAAVALGSEEHAVVAGFDRLGEVRIELDHGTSALEPCPAEILEPVLRALHAMHQPMRAVGERHDRVLGASEDLAGDEEVAPEVAGVGVRADGAGLTINAYHVLGVARDAGLVDGRAEHAEVLARSAHDAGHGIDGVGNAWSQRAGHAGDAGISRR